jgi:hypothetical protein
VAPQAVRRAHRAFWPATAIALSAYEAAAIALGKPTITDTCRFIRRHPAGRAAILGWTVGLAYHLLRSK